MPPDSSKAVLTPSHTAPPAQKPESPASHFQHAMPDHIDAAPEQTASQEPPATPQALPLPHIPYPLVQDAEEPRPTIDTPAHARQLSDTLIQAWAVHSPTALDAGSAMRAPVNLRSPAAPATAAAAASADDHAAMRQTLPATALAAPESCQEPSEELLWTVEPPATAPALAAVPEAADAPVALALPGLAPTSPFLL